ncbi:UV damage repair endonuclease UvsE [bacterium E08(2017)]|nr:UV damage repair endonuclease UvsE [bacterium E08(2017)]
MDYAGMIRLGLCCIFRKAPIKFRTTTAKVLMGMPHEDARKKLAGIIESNAEALAASIEYCSAHGIGAFRINSGILPVKTHPEAGYKISDIPGGRGLVKAFRECGELAKEKNIRLLFHPDQFVILNSSDKDLVKRSVEELRYQAEVSEWVRADVLNVHGGGVYGEREAALGRLAATIKKLPKSIKSRLTLENDDRSYRPEDLLPVCRETGVPMIYDVHHHRCLSDKYSEDEAAALAIETWNREPTFHISSPKNGWKSSDPLPHSDYLDPKDFPASWSKLDVTVEVEAKAKELAVEKLAAYLKRKYPGCMDK